MKPINQLIVLADIVEQLDAARRLNERYAAALLWLWHHDGSRGNGYTTPATVLAAVAEARRASS